MASKIAQNIASGGASKERSPYESFRHQVGLVRKDIAALVGERKVDKFIRVSLNAVQYNPKLLKADRRSLMLSCLEAAQDGLLPDGTEAVFNIYPTKIKEHGQPDRWIDVVQYLPMAYGLVQKIYESGATFVDAVAVYAKDEFKYHRGDTPKIEHVPYQGKDDPGEIIAAYCVVKYEKLETKREVMFLRDIEKVREKSKAKEGLMWKDFFDQAAIKSVIHRINKQLPQSERLSQTLSYDNRAMGLADVSMPEMDSGTDLAALIDGRIEQETREVKTEVKAPGGDVVDATVIRETKTETKIEPAKTEQERADPPKQGDPGTAALKEKIVAGMEKATAKDVLDAVYDEVRFFKWEPADMKDLSDKYAARVLAFQQTD